MNVRRASLALLVSLAVAVAPGATAFAEEPNNDDPASASVVAPDMAISFFPIAGGVKVCFDGTAAAAGSWSYGITGLRTNVTQVGGGGGSAPTTTFHSCPNVHEDNTDAGFAALHFEFQGGSNSTVTVRPGTRFGLIVWSPAGEPLYLQTTGG